CFGRDQTVKLCIHLLLVGAQVHDLSDFSGRNGSGWILPSLRIRISTRVSASSSCLRQASLRATPRSNSSRDFSSGRSPASNCLTTCSSSSSEVSNGGAG